MDSDRPDNPKIPGRDATAPPALAQSGTWCCKRRQLLRELPKRLARRLEDQAIRRPFQSRDLLFTCERTPGRLHLVVEGRVRLARFDGDGGETQLAVLDPGEGFREPAHASVHPLAIYAEGIAAGELLSIELPALRELVEAEPEAMADLAGALERG